MTRVQILHLVWGLIILCNWGYATEAWREKIHFRELLEQRRWPLENGSPPGAGVFAERASVSEESLHELINMSDERLSEFVDTHRSTLYDRWRSLHRTLENLILTGYPEIAERILLQLVRDVEMETPFKLPVEGRKDQEASRMISRYANLAYEYTLLMLVTGERRYGEAAKQIVLEFSRVIKDWNFYFEGKRFSQDHRNYLRNWRARGLFGSWYPLDLYNGMVLLRTYDTLRPWFSDSERRQVEQDLFIHHKQTIDRFTGAWGETPFTGNVSGYWRSYHNLMVYQLEGTIRYAQVLQKPEWIHEVVRYWIQYLRYTYTPDGFFREVTVDYHRQITGGMLGSIPTMLQGYTDPEGYLDKISGKRFDNLDLLKWEVLMRPIREAGRVLALPDGTYLNTNDSGPGRNQVPESEVEYGTKPGILGGAGVVKLAARGMTAHLLFGGIRGHDHLNALNLFWYAGEREVFSGTGYRPLRDSGNTRTWNTITPSHNTAMVDGINHFHNRAMYRVEQPNTAVTSQKPQSPGRHPVEVGLEIGAQYRDQGDLLLWDASSDLVQAMEAGQERAYGGVTSLFRRTVVMVPLSDGEGYLVDIFRIRGGRKHELFLRGGLDYPYSLQFDIPLKENQELLYDNLQVTHSAEFKKNIHAQASYSDGLRVISHISASNQPANIKKTLLLGKAPAIRRQGLADYSLIRYELAQTSGELDAVYVRVHETTSGAARVKGVRTHIEEGKAFIEIKRDDGTDYLLSGLDENSRFSYGEWQFTGRLAWVTVDHQQKVDGRVFSGQDLHYADHQIKGKLPLSVKVLATGSRFQGESQDFIIVNKPKEWLKEAEPRIVHLLLGDVYRLTVPVAGVEDLGGKLKVNLTHSPGFDLSSEAIYMNYFPGWRIVGEAQAILEY